MFGPKAQDPMTLIQELVKALSLFANSRVDLQSPFLHLRRSGCKRLIINELI